MNSIRPIALNGHERSLTQVKFNREGDLLFSVSKDKEASVWYSSNGERLGTLVGHGGTIWSIDVDPETNYVITGSGDFSFKLWKAETGECVRTWVLPAPVKWVEFNPTGEKAVVIEDKVMSSPGRVLVYEINQNSNDHSEEPILSIPTEEGKPKAVCAGFSYGGKYLIVCLVDGTILKYDSKTGELLAEVKDHEDLITDIQFSSDKTYFITASKDKTARIYDVDDLKLLKTYLSPAPLNTACITPVKEFVIVGGGQDAKDVTTTAGKEGNFEARFLHKIFEHEIGTIKDHFGPLNCLSVHPKGTAYASGSEDGFVKIHLLPKAYFDFQHDVEKANPVGKKIEIN
ncbi:hypothetical protein B5S31_g1396 [[Candida] boidinii]|nr:hypothetical protein B5S31_g1396 [[Candida] boidinii]